MSCVCLSRSGDELAAGTPEQFMLERIFVCAYFMLMASRIAPSVNRPRRATNVSLDPHLVEEARALDINVSRACERGLIEQIAEARAARWQAENRGAVASSNAYADTHDLPLASARLF